MAILTQPQLYALRVRLADFKRNLSTYITTINDQIFRGFSLTSDQRAIKARYDQSVTSLGINMARLDGVIEGRSLDGQLVTGEAVQALLDSFKPDLEKMQQAVLDWNKISPLGMLMNTVGSLGGAVFSSLNAVIDVVAVTATTGAAAIRWLPWVILGLVVLPPMFRILAQARRKGADAALDTAADELTAVKEKAKDVAKSVGNTVVSAGKLLLL